MLVLLLVVYEAEQAYAHEVGATHTDGDTEERVQVTRLEPGVGPGGGKASVAGGNGGAAGPAPTVGADVTPAEVTCAGRRAAPRVAAASEEVRRARGARAPRRPREARWRRGS